MDPSSLISLAGTWHFPVVGVLSSATSPTAVMGHREAAGGESTLTEQSWESRSRKKRRDSGSPVAAAAAVSDEDTSKFLSTSSGGNDLVSSSADSESKRLKSGENNVETKVDAEASSGDNKPDHPERPKQDYIHVRARRGQATDSHSLAERARREKISERMKVLQDLVPGCHKVIGKSSVLDEIINYIQALQHQVEFLSMKLEAVNSQINPGMEGFPTKNDTSHERLNKKQVSMHYLVFQFGAQTYKNVSNLAYAAQPTREFVQGSATEWLHMQVGGAFERVT